MANFLAELKEKQLRSTLEALKTKLLCTTNSGERFRLKREIKDVEAQLEQIEIKANYIE